MMKTYIKGAAFAIGVAVLSMPAMTVSSSAATFTVPVQLEETTGTVETVHWRRWRHGHGRRWFRHCHPRWRHNFRRAYCHSHRRW